MFPKKFSNQNIRIFKGHIYTYTNYKDSVYGEKHIRMNGEDYRLWDPKRSKLSAAIFNGFSGTPILEDSETLYLGASFGTTVSHISDISPEGKIFAVEFSPEPFAGLMKLAENRKNIYPVLSNARNPEAYSFFLERDPEIIYQDISQRDQLDILFNNLDCFEHWQYSLFILKATSVDSSKKPSEVLNQVTAKIKSRGGIHIISVTDISNYHKGHYLLFLENSR
ncbi:MAG: fibrillarin-like rRNA/tRNA 2'-O-methyltransferase [Candidatus Thermoplasmatota archaeon]|nr:fibrillarin-like rRNA/tRNA 2'-O-methyltransferase [Candidatus Thermoplasmatota archaeon]MCL5888884.1 fibrillarin-like rRNA/tRNA 2'-O-methyltransferase [Candidatus Thermoplasmatota archaeon]